MAKKPAVAQPEDLAQAKSSDQSVAAVIATMVLVSVLSQLLIAQGW